MGLGKQMQKLDCLGSNPSSATHDLTSISEPLCAAHFPSVKFGSACTPHGATVTAKYVTMLTLLKIVSWLRWAAGGVSSLSTQGSSLSETCFCVSSQDASKPSCEELMAALRCHAGWHFLPQRLYPQTGSSVVLSPHTGEKRWIKPQDWSAWRKSLH